MNWSSTYCCQNLTRCCLSLAPTGSPRDVQVSTQDPTTVSVSWGFIQPSLRNGVVREYRVRVTHADSGEQRILNETASPLTVSSLHPFYNYVFEVAGFTVALGPFSSPVNVRTPPDGMHVFDNASGNTLQWTCESLLWRLGLGLGLMAGARANGWS